MRHQEKIYLQTNVECLRNKDINVVNCSSDIDVFESPDVELVPEVVSGNTCVSETIQFSGTSYDTILATAVSACTSATTCLETVVWSLSVSEDGTEVYDETFWTGTTITGGTPQDATLEQELGIAFTSLGYTFGNDGLAFSVYKPYGTETLEVSLCLDIEVGLPCTSGTCSATCVTIATQTYPTISSGTTGVIIVNGENEVETDLEFNVKFSPTNAFFDAYNMTYRYEIYKFDTTTGTFHKPLVDGDGPYDKTNIVNKGFTITANTKTIESDGDYIFKSYFTTDVQTKFRNEMGEKWNTATQDNAGTNGLYRKDYDNYFVVNYSAATPHFSQSNTNTSGIGSLKVIGYVIDGSINTFTLGNNINGNVIVSLNGVTLSEGLDYTLSAVTSEITVPPVNDTLALKLTLLSPSVSGDVLTYAYVSSGNYDRLTNDVINITSPIVSGATGSQGTNDVYFNTTESKYELFTRMTPDNANDIYVTVNGVTLLNGVDYYQSITDPKRVILNGNVFVGDIINLYYGSFASIRDDIYFNQQLINWTISRPPQATNGIFTLEISGNEAFSAIIQSATTNYVTGNVAYTAGVTFSGSVGTTYYYRVKNDKNYESMCGDIINSTAYSEIVPIIVRTNSINSY